MKCDYCGEVLDGGLVVIMFDQEIYLDFCNEACAYGWCNEYYANTVDTKNDDIIDSMVEAITNE